jgi:uncharacterized protein (DUF362 family)/Pyruvate/2-oxoacid:ferredoxin oxidoreductase delta subunit
MNEPDAGLSASESTVSLTRCADYARARVEAGVREAVELLGGIERFVQPGQSVVIKPNLLQAVTPDKAVTTHPEVLRAVVVLAREAGGDVVMAESPAVGRFDDAVEKSGFGAVADEVGVPFVPLDDPVGVERPAGARFRKLRLARRVVEADVVINVPKVKTHQQVFLTLAAKNLFGCVVGREKVAWHLNAGRDIELFARALVEIANAVRPALSIADGIVGMEGPGPMSGTPRAFGFLAAGADPFAVDAVLTDLLGFAHDDYPVLVAADAARGEGLDVGETRLDRVAVVGCDAAELRAVGVRPPTGARLTFVPPFLARVLRRFVTVRPRFDRSACRLCGACVEACPAEALKIVDGRVRIDDTLCIRCFCCQELCPHGAVRARRGWLSRLLTR